MSTRQSYEKTGFADRAGEFRILGAFIAGSALLSTLLMDIIIYPISLFAVKNKSSFTHFVQYGTLCLFLAGTVFLVSRRYMLLRRGGFTFSEIAARVAKRFFRIMAWFFLSLLIGGALVLVVYFILSYNYYLLYKLAQI